MKNFGLRELRLVKPVSGWPNEEARAVSARAVDVIDAAKVYDSLDEALSGLQYVYATSGRPRDDNHVAKDVVLLRNLNAVFPYGARCGLMFGREDQGLYNEELVRANAILTIDTDRDFYSLNLGQAVLIVCYEMFKAPERPDLGAKLQLASKYEVEGMLQKLFGALEARQALNKYNRETLQYALRGLVDRVARFSSQDVAAVIKAVKLLDKPKIGDGQALEPSENGKDSQD